MVAGNVTKAHLTGGRLNANSEQLNESGDGHRFRVGDKVVHKEFYKGIHRSRKGIIVDLRQAVQGGSGAEHEDLSIYKVEWFGESGSNSHVASPDELRLCEGTVDTTICDGCDHRFGCYTQ